MARVAKATDPMPESAHAPEARGWALHWVYPSTQITELVAGRDCSIGRDTDSDVHLDDSRVSRRHATLTFGGHLPKVRDQRSSNGVYVDGQRTPDAVLRDGAVLRIGESVAVVVQTNASLQPPLDFGSLKAPYIGSGRLLEIIQLARRAASTGEPLFIHAETGSGKEYLARLVHEASGRKGALVTLNCSGLQGNLALSALFGHERGAFTGAERSVPGAVRMAAHGTLFLDEVAELPADVQALLLRTAQEGEVTPIGSNSSVRVDVRLVAASHVDLLEQSHTGGFRQDLYYRLATHRVHLPALRERREDILELFCALGHISRAQLKTTFVEQLLLHEWPGNVRELRNVASALKVREPALVRWNGHLLRSVLNPTGPIPVSQPSARALTREEWLALYEQHQRIAARVAKATGYSVSAVKRHLRRLEISPS